MKDTTKLSVIWHELKQVIDPELGINIVDLGLVYDVQETEDEICITMTLTTPGCPLSATIERMVKGRVEYQYPDKTVSLELVWEPAWTPEMITGNGRKELGWA